MSNHLKATKVNIYGNCSAFSPEGELMFRCDSRKMQWYLKRGLAELTQENPPHIRLLFKPNGKGHHGDPFFLEARKNKCVVCGIQEDLTRHHVVPHSYRRWFPRDLDRYGAYDVVALCTDHHEEYEDESGRLRKILALEYDAPLEGTGGSADPDINRAVGAAFALFRHREKIPAGRKVVLEAEVKQIFGDRELTGRYLKSVIRENRSPSKSHSQMVVEQLTCFETLGEFTIRWRKHFVGVMRPKYMPEYWRADRIFKPA